MTKFTDKQAAFIDEYLKDFNATQAAIRAGYSEKTARSQGNRLLTNVDIKEAIEELLRSRVMSRDEALYRLRRIATFDVSDYITDYGRQKGLDAKRMIADGYGHLIRGIKHSNTGTTIEWANPDDALKLILSEMKPTGNKDDPVHIAILNVDPELLK